MASQGPNYPSSGSDDAASGSVAWTNPNNIASSNDSWATVALFSSTSHFCKSAGHGFSIPPGATVDGIIVEIEGSNASGQGGSLGNYDAQLAKAGSLVSATNKSGSSSWAGSGADEQIWFDGVQSLGSSSDLWGTTWTPAEINDSGFGAGLKVSNGASSRTRQIDTTRITVYYTPAPNTAPNAPTLGTPASGALVNPTSAVSFTHTFSDPDGGDTQSAKSLRIKRGGTYYYWTGSAWTTTQTWITSSSGSTTVTAGTLQANDSDWSVATKDAAGVAGAYATDRPMAVGHMLGMML